MAKSFFNNFWIPLASVALAISFNSCSGSEKKESADNSRPNIIFIFADDLGYGELGCYGQKKIETPNIDRLASDGMIFKQYYSGSPVCAPSRCVLLTGLHSGKAQIRSNDEMGSRGDVWSYEAMLADPYLEGQRPLKEGTFTIGKMLQSIGYTTGIVGKWGLGYPESEGIPNKQGFDFFFGYNCQRQAHTYYPVHLWKNEEKVYLNNDTVAPHDWLKGADPYDMKSYSRYTLNTYSPDVMAGEITGFVNENKDRPFFLYWATTIPHVPLQAPKKWVDYYVQKFGDEEPYIGQEGRGGYFPCRYPRATYAAMISYLDEQVGQLVQQLKDLGLYENTLIMFSSDNGPIGPNAPWFESAAPFLAQADHIKGHLNEGGVRVPLIATWPKVIEPGTTNEHVSIAYDLMPTLAEITGAEIPADISGISYLPTLKGEKQKQHEYLYWEFPSYTGQMAVRLGNHKAIRKNMLKGNLEWELYDVVNDPLESKNIASEHPEIIEKVNDIVSREHTESIYERFRFTVLGEQAM